MIVNANAFNDFYLKGSYIAKPFPSTHSYSFIRHNILPTVNAQDIVLDLGCGVGGIGRYLSEVGVMSIGIDTSIEAINSAHAFARNGNGYASFYCCDIRDYLSNDTLSQVRYVIADDSLYYLDIDLLEFVCATLSNSYSQFRSLRLTFKTDRDRSCLKPNKVGSYSYKIDSGFESGLSVLCFTQLEILEFLHQFFPPADINLGYSEFKYGYGDFLKSTWVVTIQNSMFSL